MKLNIELFNILITDNGNFILDFLFIKFYFY